ncbi:hypothetical protein BD309DRAFT_975496 [Dichomitus squalens]|uniref:Uncharacterized protein n=1 Tax=Dichomitus squalens TaxID=114155 RepID=A0A4Q9PI98_9APHY|nr:hypothetical protein BD309DRAFT_975496 [Dichomitus squalens]TBU53006.1 hypothetical protein BD310DRAFT_938869 [Dichomitus squalens]
MPSGGAPDDLGRTSLPTYRRDMSRVAAHWPGPYCDHTAGILQKKLFKTYFGHSGSCIRMDSWEPTAPRHMIERLSSTYTGLM